MNTLLVGVKRTVMAFTKGEGRMLWSTKLPGGMGNGFVTVASDGQFVFAHSNGSLHCLDLDSGRLLWSNGLSGYGYGLASLCIPGSASAPDPALVQQIMEAERRRQGS
jgi:outer membrane protein assembly factor BamB